MGKNLGKIFISRKLLYQEKHFKTNNMAQQTAVILLAILSSVISYYVGIYRGMKRGSKIAKDFYRQFFTSTPQGENPSAKETEQF